MLTYQHPACLFWSKPTEDDDLWTWHAGRCGACGLERRLVLDHDHDTGRVDLTAQAFGPEPTFAELQAAVDSLPRLPRGPS